MLARPPAPPRDARLYLVAPPPPPPPPPPPRDDGGAAMAFQADYAKRARTLVQSYHYGGYHDGEGGAFGDPRNGSLL